MSILTEGFALKTEETKVKSPPDLSGLSVTKIKNVSASFNDDQVLQEARDWLSNRASNYSGRKRATISYIL